MPRSQKKIGDSTKVVIKQDMKGGEHKYGFKNNKRKKPEKAVDVHGEKLIEMKTNIDFIKDLLLQMNK